jgi:hypothetical protein
LLHERVLIELYGKAILCRFHVRNHRNLGLPVDKVDKVHRGFWVEEVDIACVAAIGHLGNVIAGSVCLRHADLPDLAGFASDLLNEVFAGVAIDVGEVDIDRSGIGDLSDSIGVLESAI